MSAAKVLVVGGGPCGAITACFLTQIGYEVTVCDKRPLSTLTHPTGVLEQSWTIGISLAGDCVLRAAGLRPEDTKMSPQKLVFLQRNLVHGVMKSVGARNWITCRSAIQAGIIQHCIKNYTEVKWLGEHEFVRLEKAASSSDQGVAVLRRPQGDVTVQFDLLVGADGVWSSVRKAAQELDKKLSVTMTQQKVEFKSFQLDHSNVPIKVLHALREKADQDENTEELQGLSADATRTDIANSIKSIMDGSVSFFTHEQFRLFMGSQGSGNPWCGVLTARSDRWSKLSKASTLRESLAKIFGYEDEQSISTIYESLSRQERAHTFGDVVWCSKVATGHIVLVGDAAHNINPLIGQGLNAGLIDAYTLALYLSGQPLSGQRYQPYVTFTGSENPTREQLRAWTQSARRLSKQELSDALQAYSKVRTPETQALVCMAEWSVWKANALWLKPLLIMDDVTFLIYQKFPKVYVPSFLEFRQGVSSYKYGWNKEVAYVTTLSACAVVGLSMVLRLML